MVIGCGYEALEVAVMTIPTLEFIAKVEGLISSVTAIEGASASAIFKSGLPGWLE